MHPSSGLVLFQNTNCSRISGKRDTSKRVDNSDRLKLHKRCKALKSAPEKASHGGTGDRTVAMFLAKRLFCWLAFSSPEEPRARRRMAAPAPRRTAAAPITVAGPAGLTR